MLVVIIVVALLIILVSGLWGIAVKGQTPRRLKITQTPDVPYEEVTISSDGDQLKGWFIKAQQNEPADSNGQAPLIIIVHGWGSSKQRMLRYTKPLIEANYALLLFDIRSHGESDEVKVASAKIFRNDVLAALNYAKGRRDVDPQRIGILAHSFGAFGSVIANKEDIGIKALVTDSMPTRFETMVQASLVRFNMPYYPLGPILARIMYFRAGFTAKQLEDFKVPQALSEQKSPVLLIHSIHDDYVPASELTYLIDNNYLQNDQVDYLFVESKGHSHSVKDPTFWQHVLPFFAKYV